MGLYSEWTKSLKRHCFLGNNARLTPQRICYTKYNGEGANLE